MSSRARTYPGLGIHCHVLSQCLFSTGGCLYYPQGVASSSHCGRMRRTSSSRFPSPILAFVFCDSLVLSRRVGHLESLLNIFSRFGCLNIKTRPRICAGSNASELCTANKMLLTQLYFKSRPISMPEWTYLACHLRIDEFLETMRARV